MYKAKLFVFALIIINFSLLAQVDQPEIGVEIGATNFGTNGGSVGGAIRGGLAEDAEEGMTYGVMVRYHHFWNNNNFTGLSGSGSLYGGGVYWHYRLMEWFFLGAELEYIRHPFAVPQSPNVTPRRWAAAGFIGAGVHKDFNWIKLNVGVQYDVIDALRDPLRPSPFRNQYFIRLSNPTQPGAGGQYLPIIYRLTFFFPLGGSSNNED
jgi:hypothetical protein